MIKKDSNMGTMVHCTTLSCNECYLFLEETPSMSPRAIGIKGSWYVKVASTPRRRLGDWGKYTGYNPGRRRRS